MKCTDCGTINYAESVKNFPKNRALLNMVKSGMSRKENDFPAEDSLGELSIKKSIQSTIDRDDRTKLEF